MEIFLTIFILYYMIATLVLMLMLSGKILFYNTRTSEERRCAPSTAVLFSILWPSVVLLILSYYLGGVSNDRR